MNEKELKMILIVFLLVVIVYSIISIIDKLADKYELKSCEKYFKEQYEKYKPYLLNKTKLCLAKPKKLLFMQLYSEPFRNNTELRRSFMQVAQGLRDWNMISEKTIDPEVEAIFKEIRQVAFLSGEDFDIDNLYTD